VKKKEIKYKIDEIYLTLSKFNTDNDSRVITAKKEYRRIWNEVDNELSKEREKLEVELVKLKELALPKKRVIKEVPGILKKWLKDIGYGIAESPKWEIVWYSNNLKYVIVKHPGGLYWGGIGHPQNYASSRYNLCEVKKHHRYGDEVITFIEGRLTQEKYQELINKIPVESREGVRIK
jgi:hypothetical protein